MDTLIATEKMVPLAPFTTLDLGGDAHHMIRIKSYQDAVDAVGWWRSQSQPMPLLALGGGSNLLISDAGFRGLVVKMENTDIQVLDESNGTVLVEAGAGAVWERFVAYTVDHGWAGVECLSGIPGCVGAAPVQNIGAYGQEVAETIEWVKGIDLQTGEAFQFTAIECEFAYRDSFFKKSVDRRYLITSVAFRLRPGGQPTIRYHDLQNRCQEEDAHTLMDVRELVLEIRRSKSMVYDKSDPNHRSAGSFFTNPIVDGATADRIEASLKPGVRFPRFEVEGGIKLSAAWLIDNAGLKKGFKISPEAKVGLSTNHVLALTNRGGAKAEELLELCRHVQQVVKAAFGVELEPEPVFVGF